MSENTSSGFGKFVPGFDFLQNLAKGATQNMPHLQHLSNWIAPTMNVEELEKRITELKAVQFWLDQNGKALGATIQALEVQKMTLATLEGMNVSMGDLANAMKLKPDAMFGGMQKMTEAATDAAEAMTGGTGAARKKAPAKKAAGASGKPNAAAGVVDPLQWWGALTTQFQEIAASAMQDVAQKTPFDAARNVAGGMAKEAMKAADAMAKAASGSAANPAARKRTARKTAARKTGR